jgi:DNA-directed RNA polymerase subunit omega
MLHPSYSDLMGVINDRSEQDGVKVKSRYSVIIATSKRARQLIEENQSYVEGDDDFKSKKNSMHIKELSCAVEELYEGKIDII